MGQAVNMLMVVITGVIQSQDSLCFNILFKFLFEVNLIIH